MPTISNSKLRNLEEIMLAMFYIMVRPNDGSFCISDNKGSRSMARTLAFDEAVTVAL